MLNGSLDGLKPPVPAAVRAPAGRASLLRGTRARVAALSLLFVVLSLVYNTATPLFEAPDERDHFSYAHWLAEGNGLPHLVDDRDSLGEIWQPPLYYALVAAVIAPVDRADFAATAPLSADWLAGRSRLAHVHRAAEDFPYRGTALAVHLARALSTLLGLITVLCTYGIARRIVPGYALVAAGLVALNPQFIFISSAVNNDNLVIALSSVVLWLVVRAVTDRDGRAPRWPWYVALGALWGLAALAKLTGLTLGLAIGLGLVGLALRRRSWRPLLLGGLLAGATAALVCGWWFVRNWQLYGDPLAWNEMLVVTAGLVRPQLLSWPETLRYASFLRVSYWAMFGYGFAAPDSFYWMIYGIMAVAAAGLAVGAARFLRRARPWTVEVALRAWPVLLLVAWSLTVALFLLRWMRQIDTTNQGRLLYPAVAALAVLLALGLAALDSRRRWLGVTAVTVLGCWAAALPVLTFGPAFDRPALLPADAALPNAFDARYGEAIRLRGYELPAAAELGRPVEVALYWQADRPVDASYVVAVRILDPTGRVATGLDALPAEGRYPTLSWEPGRPFRDVYRLPPISADAAPGLGRLLVTLYPGGDPGSPLPVTAGGAPAGSEAYLGAIKIPPAEAVDVAPAAFTDAVFAGRFRLLGHDLPAAVAPGDPLPLTLYWEATAPDGADYTVFIHVVDAAGTLVAQADGPPRGGQYPTSIWSVGERVVDPRAVDLPADLPPGLYTVLVGLYDPATGQRLAAATAAGDSYAADALELGRVQVVEP